MKKEEEEEEEKYRISKSFVATNCCCLKMLVDKFITMCCVSNVRIKMIIIIIMTRIYRKSRDR